MSVVNSRLLDGEWPTLGQTAPIPQHIIQLIKDEAIGTSLTNFNSYLSLGYFYIHTSLLEAHPLQRPIDHSHVQRLKADFEERGILRTECPGVVIGLGEGWNELRNTTPNTLSYKISPSCPHLNRLALSSGGKIGQVIRGGHRTAAVALFAETPETFHESYWYYNVLVPGLFS